MHRDLAEEMNSVLAEKPQTSPSRTERERAVRIVAKSLYRELVSQGFDERQIVELATALIGTVTDKGPAA